MASPFMAAITGFSSCHILKISFFWVMSVVSICALISSLDMGSSSPGGAKFK